MGIGQPGPVKAQNKGGLSTMRTTLFFGAALAMTALLPLAKPAEAG